MSAGFDLLPLLQRCQRCMIWGAALLVALHLAVVYALFAHGWSSFALQRMLWLDAENNLPSWFSGTSLLFCCLLLAALWKTHRLEPDGRYWAGLAILLGLMSLDEVASVHEAFMGPLRRLTGATGYLYFTWVVPGALFALVFGIAYLRFLWRLPAAVRNGLLLAGAVYLLGALGAETLGGPLYEQTEQREALTYAILVAIEESLEMTGIWLLFRVLVAQIGQAHLVLVRAPRRF